MGRQLELHGEIAGLHAGGHPAAEFIFGASNLSLLALADFDTVGAKPREDANGNGGKYAIGRDGSGTCAWNSPFSQGPLAIVGKTIVEGFVRIPIHRPTTNNSFTVEARTVVNTSEHWKVFVNTSGDIQITTDNLLRLSLAGVIPAAPGEYPVLTIWFRIDASDGWVRVYKDFNYDAPLMNWEGNVYENFGGIPALVQELAFALVNNDAAVDDVIADDITLRVSPTSGSLQVGETFTTDDLSDAIITRIDDIPGSAHKMLQLTKLTYNMGTDWDGSAANDPFQSSTSLQGNTSLAQANIIGGGLQPNSVLPKNTYFNKAQQPTANGATIQLGGSPTQVATEEWKNVAYDGGLGSTYLGLGPDAEVSYNFDATGGNADLYAVQPTGVNALEIAEVVSVGVYAWARKEGSGIDDFAPGVRSGATTEFADPSPLGTSFDVHYRAFNNDPDTAAPWVPAAVDAMQIGGQFS